MILHIPHSSTNIEDYDIDQESINALTDWYTDDLFYKASTERIVFNYSRFICDVERFEVDEPMEKFGMGLQYTKNIHGKEIVPKWSYEGVLALYRRHHKKFVRRVDYWSGYFALRVIVDCHSFPDIPLPYEEDKSPRPDICIGTDEFHTPEELTDEIKSYFTENGLTVEINKPYSGSIVPEKYYKKDTDVKSIMIEVNRKLYLTADFKKNDNYNKTKEMLTGMLNIVSKYEEANYN